MQLIIHTNIIYNNGFNGGAFKMGASHIFTGGCDTRL